MFYERNSDGYHPIIPGIKIKTLVHGEKTLLSEFKMEKGSILPLHHHPQEQTGYLISGRIRLFIGDEALTLEPGGSWCVPADMDHRAEILEDSIAIEVFSPLREDYLAYFPKNLE